jgi:hypothetical protein
MWQLRFSTVLVLKSRYLCRSIISRNDSHSNLATPLIDAYWLAHKLSLPSEVARSSSLSNMAARSRRTNIWKALRLACWNADGLRGWRIELNHFHSQHGVDTCILNGTHLGPGQVFRFANYICHWTDPSTKGRGKAILVRQGIDNPWSSRISPLTSVAGSPSLRLVTWMPSNSTGIVG